MGNGGARRLLVIRLSSLGDVARLLPSLKAIGAAPGLEADLTTEDRFKPLMELFPFARQVIAYPRRTAGSPVRSPFGFSRAMRDYFAALRARRYDLALDLHGIFRSALVARLSGAAETAGYARGFGKEFSHLLYGRRLVPGPSPLISRYERYAGALKAIGAPSPPDEYIQPVIPEAAGKVLSGLLDAWGAPPRQYAVAFIGSSRAQRRKRWPLENYLACAGALYRETGMATAVTWGPEEAGLVKSLPQRPELKVPPLLDLAATVALIQNSRVFMGADTGFTHISALMGVPTVAVLGPTDPTINRPFGNRSRVVYKPGVHRECGGEGCTHEDCMAKIEPGEVAAQVRGLLEAT